MDNKIENISSLFKDSVGNQAYIDRIKTARLAMANSNFEQVIEILPNVFEESNDKKIKAEAATLLGTVYCKSKSKFYDKRKAEKYFSYARGEKYPEAMFVYGVLCYRGNSYVSMNKEIGVQWIKLAADAGYRDAYSELGYIYLEDLKDESLSFQYYKKAADAGDPVAYFGLGVHYLRVNKNDLALQNFQEAANRAKIEDDLTTLQSANEEISKIEKPSRSNNVKH